MLHALDEDHTLKGIVAVVSGTGLVSFFNTRAEALLKSIHVIQLSILDQSSGEFTYGLQHRV